MDSRRRFSLTFESPWIEDYLMSAALVEDTLAGEDFRLNFSIPREMFDEILEDMRHAHRERTAFICAQPGYKEAMAWATRHRILSPSDGSRLANLSLADRTRLVRCLRDAGCPFDAHRLFDDEQTKTKMARRPPVLSDALKLLGHLHLLRHGGTVDTIQTQTGVSPRTLLEFHVAFPHWFRRRNYRRWVRPPVGRELADVVEIFAKLGATPGAMCLKDATHLGTERAPAVERYAYVGREGYPTYGVDVACGPDTYVYTTTDAFPGSNNDKTLVKHCAMVKKLRDDAEYTNFEFQLHRDDTTTMTMQGLYAVVDGGYLKWLTLMPPFKHSLDERDVLWSQRVESIRKIIECLFGRLKRRFGILRESLRTMDEEWINSMWRETLILHNMLLIHDGFALTKSGAEWVPASLDVDEARARTKKHGPLHATDDSDDVGGPEAGFDAFRHALVKHFEVARAKREVYWLV